MSWCFLQHKEASRPTLPPRVSKKPRGLQDLQGICSWIRNSFGSRVDLGLLYHSSQDQVDWSKGVGDLRVLCWRAWASQWRGRSRLPLGLVVVPWCSVGWRNSRRRPRQRRPDWQHMRHRSTTVNDSPCSDQASGHDVPVARRRSEAVLPQTMVATTIALMSTNIALYQWLRTIRSLRITKSKTYIIV